MGSTWNFQRSLQTLFERFEMHFGCLRIPWCAEMSKNSPITVTDSLLYKGEIHFFDQNSIVRYGIDFKLSKMPPNTFLKVREAFWVFENPRVGKNIENWSHNSTRFVNLQRRNPLFRPKLNCASWDRLETSREASKHLLKCSGGILSVQWSHNWPKCRKIASITVPDSLLREGEIHFLVGTQMCAMGSTWNFQRRV